MKDSFEATPSSVILPLTQPTDFDALLDSFVRSDVNMMSIAVFGQPYAQIKSILYPSPAYRAFFIKKRSGGIRTINEPRMAVKALQLKALDHLNKYQDTMRPCVHGFVKGRSILTNAQAHSDRKIKFLLNIDLEDFFPSITFFRVRGVLEKAPFNFSFEVATVIAQLCTFQGTLPQGAPTSPYISNLICRSLDRELMELAKRHRCTYTRYADDMTFSFSVANAENLPKNLCTFDGGIAMLGDELQDIIKRHSFRINEKKTRISSKNSRQEVTGLTVNSFPNVRRKFVDEVRGALNAWSKYGYQLAQESWQVRIESTADEELQNRAWRRQTLNGSGPKLHNYLWGKLLFMRMVRQENDPLYNRLAEKYNFLIEKEKGINSHFKAASLPIHFEVQGEGHASKALYVVEWMGDIDTPGATSGDTEAVTVQGTAFAYRRSDMLITCEHIFRFAPATGNQVDFENVPGAALTVFNVATKATSSATLVYRDLGRDLAVLKLDNPGQGMRHFLGSQSPAKQQQFCWLLGFPNWSPNKPENVKESAVTTVFTKGGLKRFEISSNIRKGNSGGPVVSKLWTVLGVAQEGATQAEGNDQCLCVGELDAWLDSLALDAQFPPLKP